MSIIENKNHIPPLAKNKSRFSSWLISVLIDILIFAALAVIFYLIFSSFDTRREAQMRESTQQLNDEYKILTARFDSLSTVVNNIEEREASVFKAIFEAYPYDFDKEQEIQKWQNYERLFLKSNNELAEEFFNKITSFKQNTDSLKAQSTELIENIQKLGSKANYIPAIQPVINPDLTLLASSYGMRMHPFYRTLTMHNGVDFSMAENSRIFATADGKVSKIVTKGSTAGNSVTIDHGNGYKTVYNHLNKINVKYRQSIRRGDIIGLSGNTGLSFAAHLHYEVLKDGKNVDPIHFFFMELSAERYNKMLIIAQSGMQSLD